MKIMDILIIVVVATLVFVDYIVTSKRCHAEAFKEAEKARAEKEACEEKLKAQESSYEETIAKFSSYQLERIKASWNDIVKLHASDLNDILETVDKITTRPWITTEIHMKIGYFDKSIGKYGETKAREYSVTLTDLDCGRKIAQVVLDYDKGLREKYDKLTKGANN